MTLKKILVAFDGSESSEKALDMAADIAAPNADIQLDIANVVAIPLLSDEQVANFASVLEMMEQDADKLLDQAFERVDSKGLENEVHTLLIKGVDAAAELAKLVEQEGYDMLVVGSRGLSGIKEYLGSVSHKLLGAASIPVLVVK